MISIQNGPLSAMKQREDGSYYPVEIENFGDVTPIAMIQDQDSGRSVLIVADGLHDSPTAPPNMRPVERRIEQMILTYRGDSSPSRLAGGEGRFPGPRPFRNSGKPPKRGEKRTRPNKPHKADAPHLPKAKCRR